MLTAFIIMSFILLITVIVVALYHIKYEKANPPLDDKLIKQIAMALGVTPSQKQLGIIKRKLKK